MNLIPCASPCVHGKDGYCTLGGISEPSGSTTEDCGYYLPSLPSFPENGGEGGCEGGDGEQLGPVQLLP